MNGMENKNKNTNKNIQASERQYIMQHYNNERQHSACSAGISQSVVVSIYMMAASRVYGGVGFHTGLFFVCVSFA